MYASFQVDPFAIPLEGEYDYEPGINHTTYLFRGDANISTVLPIAAAGYVERDGDEPFTFLSVGCSTGAEIDSVLSFVEGELPFLGKLCVRGTDVCALTLSRAKRAKHVLLSSDGHSEASLQALLPPVLSNVSRAEPDYDFSQWMVDTGALRARHDVAFLQADLAEESADIPEVDLVSCHNVLYHILEDDKASRLIEGMVKLMRPGAYLSLETPYGLKRIADDDRRYRPHDYNFWRRDIAEELARRGIAAIRHDEDSGVAFLFQQSPTTVSLTTEVDICKIR